MADFFQAARGCFTQHTYTQNIVRSGSQDSFFKVSNLDESAEEPILINDIRVNDKDIYSTKLCFNDKRILYTYGRAFGTLTIEGEILLGPQGLLTEAEEKLTDWFDEYRSTNLDPSNTNGAAGVPKASLGNGVSYLFYPVALNTGILDKELNILGFSILGVIKLEN